MTSQQIQPINTQISTSGLNQFANGIIQIQQPQNAPQSAFILCDSNTVYINGQTQFNPPIPSQQQAKIFSPDLSSQIECVNGGSANITGIINGYSTTSQTNSSISTAISDLSTVYMPISQTLNNIPLANGLVNLNNQQIENLANPTSNQDAVNLQYLQSNYSDTIETGQLIQSEINELSSVYQSINTQLNLIPAPIGSLSLNSQKITNLLAGTLSTDAINLNQLNLDYKDTIKNSANTCSVTSAISGINMTIDQQVNKLQFFIPQGQATQPASISTSDKLQFVTGLGSISYNNTMAQTAQPTVNTFGSYITQPNNDFTKNQNVQLQLQCKNLVAPQQSQALTLASGHINIGSGMSNYSLLYNAPDGLQQSLTLSAGTPNSDQSLTFYSDTFATQIGQTLTAQFTKKVGYSAGVTVTETQQFATKQYVDSNVGSGISLITAKQNFIALDGTQTNLITAPIPMNGQKITGIANGSNAQDVVSFSQMNSAISLSAGTVLTSSFKSAQVVVGNLNTIAQGQTAVSSVSGFITGGTKVYSFSGDQGFASNRLTFLFPVQPTIPQIQVSFIETGNASGGVANLQLFLFQGGTRFIIRSITTSQIQLEYFVTTPYGNIPLINNLSPTFNLLFVTNAIV